MTPGSLSIEIFLGKLVPIPSLESGKYGGDGGGHGGGTGGGGGCGCENCSGGTGGGGTK